MIKTAAEVKEKKSRNADPGVRVQGGRIYCSKTGTTCHQCRQKTVEDKRQCTTCNQQFCPKCLINRYGPDQEEASRLPKWSCPKCLKNCSCSYCRKKAGLAPTGILANAAKALGFASVDALLKVNPEAAQINLPAHTPAVQTTEEPPADATILQGASQEGISQQGKAVGKGKAGRKRKVDASTAQEATLAAVPDFELGPRPSPMPDAEAAVVQRPEEQHQSWPRGLSSSMPLPADCSLGHLLEVLEFAQAFGSRLNLPATHPAILAGRLLQPCTSGPAPALQPADQVCPLTVLHVELLKLVNTGSQIRVHILPENWHHELCRLFLCRTSLHRQPPSTQQAPDGPVSTERPTRCSSTDDLPPGFGSHADSSAAALTADRNASARADGEVSSNDVSIRPARLPDTCKASGKENAPQQANGQQQKGGDPQKGGSEQRAAEGGQLPAAAGAGSEQDMAQYWALAPGVRLRLLRDLCHAALDHYIIRHWIDDVMGARLVQQKGQREAQAQHRRQARQDIKQLQEQEIALLVARGTGGGMSLEEQKASLAAARAKAHRALAKDEEDVGPAEGSCPCARQTALGCDRDGRLYWHLQSATAFTGGLLVQTVPGVATDEAEVWAVHMDSAAVAQALHPQGVLEGPLRKRIAGLPMPDANVKKPDSVSKVVRASNCSLKAESALDAAPKGKKAKGNRSMQNKADSTPTRTTRARNKPT